MERSIPLRQIVQAGLGSTPDRGIIQSLWFEIPANCDLRCPYCFCATENGQDVGTSNLAYDADSAPRYSATNYRIYILEPFANRIKEWNKAHPQDRIRGKVAIPGAGEPFDPRNKELVLQIIEVCEELGIHLTIFTTAHWIDEELARWLAPKDIVLLVKYNSQDQANQNKLVGLSADTKHDYFQKRENALKLLMREDIGFNRPYDPPGSIEEDPLRHQDTRLGIVTSVMRSNLSELPTLLRYARDNHLIFDCDTILERGRGDGCDEIPSDEDTHQAFLDLQRIDREEFGKHWDISRSYVGTTCDRFRHHLYITKTGLIAPCVGSQDMVLGNVMDGPTALYEAWARPLMREVIRRHEYDGPCSVCMNALEEKCFSCLGRCRETTGNQSVEAKASIQTTGCWNHRPDPMHVIWEAEEKFRAALRPHPDRDDHPCQARHLVEKGQLEKLWWYSPATIGSVQPSQPTWARKDVHLSEVPHPLIEIQKCRITSGKETNCHWREAIADGEVKNSALPKCCAQLLPSVLLPATEAAIFDRQVFGDSILWTTFMLFDEKVGLNAYRNEKRAGYVFRTVYNIDGDDRRMFLLLMRSAELVTAAWRKKPTVWQGDGGDPRWIVDFSDEMRRTEDPNYVLRHRPTSASEQRLHEESLFADKIWDDPEVQRKAHALRRALLSEFPESDPVFEFLLSTSFSSITQQDALTAKADRIDDILRAHLFASLDSYPALQEAVREFLDDTLQSKLRRGGIDLSKSLKDSTAQLANYFIWIAAISDRLQSYCVRHMHDIRYQGDDGRERRDAFKPSGMVVASTDPFPSDVLAARSQMVLSNVLAPLRDYYAGENLGSEKVAMYARGASHSLKNSMAGPANRLDIGLSVSRDIEAIRDTMLSLAQYDDYLHEDASRVYRAVSNAAIAAYEMDFLRRQAQVMFWTMDPERFRADIKNKQLQPRAITIEDLRTWLIGSCIAAVEKTETGMLARHNTEVSFDLATKPTDSLADIQTCIYQALQAAVDLTLDVDPLLATPLDPAPLHVLENVAFELFTNAFTAAISVAFMAEQSAKVRISAVGSTGGIKLTVSNSCSTESLSRLTDKWDVKPLYEDSGSRGVSGLNQMHLLMEVTKSHGIADIGLGKPIPWHEGSIGDGSSGVSITLLARTCM